MVALPILSILNGQTVSNRNVNTALETDDATSLLILCPTTLPEAITIAISADGGTTFPYTLQNNGADIVLAAAKAIAVTIPLGMIWQLKAGGAVAAQRDFNLQKEIFISGHF